LIHLEPPAAKRVERRERAARERERERERKEESRGHLRGADGSGTINGKEAAYEPGQVAPVTQTGSHVLRLQCHHNLRRRLGQPARLAARARVRLLLRPARQR